MNERFANDIKQNLNSNGSTTNSEVTTDDDENALDSIPPQKASSPMIPKINGSSQNATNKVYINRNF